MRTTNYIPTLRFKWLTPLYDFLLRVTMPEQRIKEKVIALAGIPLNAKVLDFGCGTGTLTIMIKESHPDAIVSGIDIDISVLNQAIRKAESKGLDILLLNYDGRKLPFQNDSFQIVISCLVFHHLDSSIKRSVLEELFRVMDKNGQLIIADSGRSKSWLHRILFNLKRGLDGYKSTYANAKGLLPEFISDAGFEMVNINNRIKTIFGEVQLVSAGKI